MEIKIIDIGLISLLWITGSITYFYLYNRKSKSKGYKEVKIITSNNLVDKPKSISIKLNFTVPDHLKDDLSCDMVLKWKDIISGNYKIPNHIKKQLEKANEKGKRSPRKKKNEIIKESEPAVTVFNDPEASEIDFSTAPKITQEMVDYLSKEEGDTFESEVKETFLKNKYGENGDSDDIISLKNHDSEF